MKIPRYARDDNSARFPIPDSRFPIPDSRLPIPDSLFPNGRSSTRGDHAVRHAHSHPHFRCDRTTRHHVELPELITVTKIATWTDLTARPQLASWREVATPGSKRGRPRATLAEAATTHLSSRLPPHPHSPGEAATLGLELAHASALRVGEYAKRGGARRGIVPAQLSEKRLQRIAPGLHLVPELSALFGRQILEIPAGERRIAARIEAAHDIAVSLEERALDGVQRGELTRRKVELSPHVDEWSNRIWARRVGSAASLRERHRGQCSHRQRHRAEMPAKNDSHSRHSPCCRYAAVGRCGPAVVNDPALSGPYPAYPFSAVAWASEPPALC